ncbi:MAG: hypothetical protein ABI725_05070 [Chloroflexota bacterium]
MRVASVVVACAIFIVGCGTQVPTPSPSPSPGSSNPPTLGPSPTVGPTTDTGLPTTILGLPVYTVAGINRLAASGALDGRFAAVAGYLRQYALPCPFMPHQPPLSGFCYGGRFGDTPESVEGTSGMYSAPLAVTETSGARSLWNSSTGPFGGDSSRVALIVHAGDPRSWQCDPAQQSACAARLVIDRVVWANDAEVVLDQLSDGLQMTLDQVIGAAAGVGETEVLAWPLKAGALNDVDPRFIGQGLGNVWYVRLMTAAPGADGMAPGKDVLLDDATGAVIATLPLEVDPAYSPARVTLDTNGQVSDKFGEAHFLLTRSGFVLANGVLNSSSSPFALEPGDYSLTAWGNSGAILASPRPLAECSLDFSLAAGDDVTYYADWPHRGDCTWKQGAWPFN